MIAPPGLSVRCGHRCPGRCQRCQCHRTMPPADPAITASIQVCGVSGLVQCQRAAGHPHSPDVSGSSWRSLPLFIPSARRAPARGQLHCIMNRDAEPAKSVSFALFRCSPYSACEIFFAFCSEPQHKRAPEGVQVTASDALSLIFLGLPHVSPRHLQSKMNRWEKPTALHHCAAGWRVGYSGQNGYFFWP